MTELDFKIEKITVKADPRPLMWREGPKWAPWLRYFGIGKMVPATWTMGPMINEFHFHPNLIQRSVEAVVENVKTSEPSAEFYANLRPSEGSTLRLVTDDGVVLWERETPEE